MRKICLMLFYLFILSAVQAQTSVESFIEGSKTIVQLISFLKKSKFPGRESPDKQFIPDSCAQKMLADLCFKNSTSKDLSISLFKRIESGYEWKPFTVKVLPKKQECLYELKSGVFKYRIETDNSTGKLLLSEGEFKLQPCDNMKREIKE